MTAAARAPAPRALRRLVASAAGLGLVWVLAGVRVLDPAREVGVRVSARSGAAETVNGRFATAFPGFSRVSRWPRTPVPRSLPEAAIAMLPAEDGSRFGLQGTIVVHALPERAAALARGAGEGVDGTILAAVRASASALTEAEAERSPGPPSVRSFQARLADELASRGLGLDALDVQGFDHLLAEFRVAPVAEGARVMIVGLDGADWEIVNPLLEAGRLPNLRRLIDRGVRAKLLSITPMLSPVVWTSIATGVEPRRHGVMDFLAPASDGHDEPVTSRSREVPAIWNLLSEAGVPVSVTGWWATWPAEPVDGMMVTDRVAYQLFGYSTDPRNTEGKTWPPVIYDAIRPGIVSPDNVPWEDVAHYLDGPRRTLESFDTDERSLLEDFRTLLASGRTYLDAALTLRRLDHPRFEAVYFEGTDTVGHLFMPYRPPQLAGIDPRRYASFHDVVDRYYETADAMLGRLLEGRDDWTVIVCSDHGFASDATRPLTTDSRIGRGAAADWHRRFGLFVMSGPGIRAGARLDEASIYDIAPTVLALFGQPVPASWPGRVLAAAFEPERFARSPVVFRGDPASRAKPAAGAGGGDEEAEELREKLASLGYVSAGAPSLMTTNNNNGVALLAAGRYDEAAAAFRAAIAESPQQATLWVNLGIALRYAGKTDEARTWLEKAFAVPSAQRSAGFHLAQIELDAGSLAAAEGRLRRVLVREPGASEVHDSLGLVLERQGKLREAASEYEAAARLDENAAEPRNNLGNLARRAGRGDEAERQYLGAIDADPYFMGAYNNLALLYQDRGQIDRALALYDRALARAPRNAVVLNNLASLYFARGDRRAAREAWDRAVEADPKYASPLNNLAGLAMEEGDDAKAEELLSKALELDANYGDALINRSFLARKRGQIELARQELHAAAADPRSAGSARLQLGILELQEGNPRDALTALQDASRQLPERSDLLNALGEAQARVGNRNDALRAWRRSLELDPAQPRLVQAVQDLEKQE